MNSIELGTYISRNGTKVVKEIVDKKVICRTVQLLNNPPLKKASIDKFYKNNKGDCSENLSQITAFSDEKGILTQGHENVKNLIQAIKRHRLKV